MAVTDLVDLEPALSIESGITDPAVLQALLIAAVPKFNAEVGTPFTLTGTLLEREATDKEERYLIISAILIYLSGRMIFYSLLAISSSNVAGKTDLRGIELALSKRRLELLAELEALNGLLGGLALATETTAQELGETLRVSGSPLYNVNSGMWDPWGWD